MILVYVGDCVLDEATGETLYVLEKRYSRLLLVAPDGSSKYANRGNLLETSLGLKLPIKVKTIQRPGLKPKLIEEAAALETERLNYTFSSEIEPFTVARLVRLIASSGLSVAEYFEGETAAAA